MTRRILGAAACVLTALACTPATAGLLKGSPDIKSAGPLAFGPDGLLLVGDTAGAAVFAIETGDRAKAQGKAVNLAKVDEKVAAALGTTAKDIQINDMVVNPASGRVYLSVARGRGPDALPVIVRVDADGTVTPLELKDTAYAKAELPKAPGEERDARGNSPRAESITDIAFVDGRIFVAGLSNEEFSSRLIAIPYPFSEKPDGTSIEIFHGAHGRLETRSPVRTFVPYAIEGKPYLMAAYTCTPLVKIPVSELKPGSHVKGTTVAELGNRNRPLDMIVYRKGDKEFLLLANSNRGVMKIPTGEFASAEPIEKPVREERKGVGYETIKDLSGVMQLDSLDDAHAVVLVRGQSGDLSLKTVDLP